MSYANLTDKVRDTLNELRRRAYKLSIGSSSKNTKFILGQIGLGDFFNAIADGTDITRSKPDPEVFLKSAEKISIAPPTAPWWRTPRQALRRPRRAA